MTADLQERRLVLENLDSELFYEAFMMVSTYGGSLNGSRIYFKVDPYGWYYIIRSGPMTPMSVILMRSFVIPNLSLFLDAVTVISITLSFGVALTAFIIIAIHLSSRLW